VESGERFTAELWARFGGQQRSEERVRARWSELATVSPLRPRFWRERAGPGATYGHQMSTELCRRSATSMSSALIQLR